MVGGYGRGISLRLTSRERVLAAFDHTEGDRVPLWCGASEEFWQKAKNELALDDEELRIRIGDDFRRVFGRDMGPEHPLSTGATYRTPFGIERTGFGYGMPLSHPLEHAGLAEIEAYPWPDPQWIAVDTIRAEAEVYQNQFAILGGDWSPFWHDAIDLFGMDSLMRKMYEEPQIVDAVIGHIVDYYAEVSQRIFEAAADSIDIFFVGNDFGSQNGPLVSEALFRRFLLPSLARLVDLGHQYRLRVMLHCCGGVAELIPAMIEVGLDGLHAIQPSCRGMDLAVLKANFGPKLLFNGGIDSQHVLIEGTAHEVREKTREVLDIMKPGGGYIAGASHDTILEETPLENVLAMFETIREYGIYN